MKEDFAVSAFFDMLLTKGDDDKPYCKCKKCGNEYLSPGSYGTETLKRHIESCYKKRTKDISQLILGNKNGSMSVSSSKFYPDTFRELLVAAIVMHDLPFRFVEYIGVQAIFSYLRCDVVHITRNTANADTLKIYKREKDRIKSMLKSAPGRISLTFDLWTLIITDGYMCLTAHFLDKNWVLHKRVLNFCLMPPPHHSISLSEKIYNLLCEWGIENKIFFCDIG